MRLLKKSSRFSNPRYGRLIGAVRTNPSAVPTIEGYPDWAMALTRCAGGFKSCFRAAGAPGVALSTRWAPYARSALLERRADAAARRAQTPEERAMDDILLALPKNAHRWLRRARSLPSWTPLVGGLDARVEDPDARIKEEAAAIDNSALRRHALAFLRSDFLYKWLAVLDRILRFLRL